MLCCTAGKLKYTDLHIRKPLLPPLSPEASAEECRIRTPNLHCFHAGDNRVTRRAVVHQAELQFRTAGERAARAGHAPHALAQGAQQGGARPRQPQPTLVRRQVGSGKLKNTCSDLSTGYRVFLETRRFIGAVMQHITYNEWLPIILGPRVLEIFELKLLPRGYYTGYNDSVNPTMANAFAAAAFR